MATAVSLPAGSPDRELGALALDFSTWRDGSGLPIDTRADITETIAGLELARLPLAQTEPHGIARDGGEAIGYRFDGEATRRLGEALRPIGMKLNPTMSPEQVGGWLAAMIASLSDLPARVAIRGAHDALHVAIRFFPEVEGIIRAKAERHAMRYDHAIYRLRQLQREIAAAATPKLNAPVTPELSAAEILRMGTTPVGKTVLRVGLLAGHLTQAEYDAAMSVE